MAVLHPTSSTAEWIFLNGREDSTLSGVYARVALCEPFDPVRLIRSNHSSFPSRWLSFLVAHPKLIHLLLPLSLSLSLTLKFLGFILFYFILFFFPYPSILFFSSFLFSVWDFCLLFFGRLTFYSFIALLIRLFFSYLISHTPSCLQ